MSTELELLCRYLNANNKTESEKLFFAYYNTIGKKLLSYFKYSLGLNDARLAEEFFQETITEIFNVCIKRPQAAKRIEELTRELEALDLDNPFLKKRTHTWTNDVRYWANEAICFPMEHSQTKSPELDDKVKNFNNKINPLEKEGEDVLDWLANNKKNIPEENEFFEKANELIKKPKPRLLSKIRIPTSALLYEMAGNKTKNHWKKHSTQFEIALEPDWNSEDEEDTQASIIEEADYQGYLESECQQNQGIDYEEAIKFLLQAPVRKAINQLQNATNKEEILRSKNRLDKASINYTKHLETLEMMKAEYTQDEIAVNLGLTRDQVRTLKAQIKVLLEPLQGNLS